MILYLGLFFILGSAVGSFLNVVADRVMRGQSILGRSQCEFCKSELKSIDLVPILSFVVLGARCRYCKKKLSWQYPIVEFVTALLFSLAFLALASSGEFKFLNLGYWFFVISVCVVVATVDYKFSLIPTSFVYAASLFSLFFIFLTNPSPIFLNHVLGAFGASVFFLLIVLVTFGRGMGQGDVVLAFFLGLVLGTRATILAVFLAFFSGAVISIFLIILGRKKFGNTVPFGPFLIFGFIVALFWAEPLLNFYFKMLY